MHPTIRPTPETMNQDDDIDYDEIRMEACARCTDLGRMCTPDNPTGSMMVFDEVRHRRRVNRLLAMCLRDDVIFDDYMNKYGLKPLCEEHEIFSPNGFIRLEGYSLANDEEGTLGINFLPINEDDC